MPYGLCLPCGSGPEGKPETMLAGEGGCFCPGGSLGCSGMGSPRHVASHLKVLWLDLFSLGHRSSCSSRAGGERGGRSPLLPAAGQGISLDSHPATGYLPRPSKELLGPRRTWLLPPMSCSVPQPSQPSSAVADSLTLGLPMGVLHLWGPRPLALLCPPHRVSVPLSGPVCGHLLPRKEEVQAGSHS